MGNTFARKKAVVFDLLNTLVQIKDESSLITNVKSGLGEEKYQNQTDKFVLFHINKLSEDEFIRIFSEKHHFMNDDLTLVRDFLHPKITIHPDVTETLKILKNHQITIGLLSDSPPTAKVIFKELEIAKYIDVSIFSCDVGLLKPDIKIFDVLVSAMEKDKDEILFIGDSVKDDIQGAQNADIAAVLLDRENTTNFDPKIGNLIEVARFI